MLGQSVFSTTISTGIDTVVCTGGPPFCVPREMTNLIPSWATESTQFLDGSIVISPKFAYSWDNTADQLYVVNPGYLTYSGPTVSYYRITAEPPDLVIAPDMTRFFVAGDGEIGVLDVMDGDVRSFVTPSIQTPMAVAFNRQRNLYVLDEVGSLLVLVDTDSDIPAELNAVDLPGPCVALAPDDSADEVALLSLASERLYRLPWHLDGGARGAIIPGGLPLTGSLHMAVHPADGAVMVCTDQYDGPIRFEENPFGGPLIVTQYEHPELAAPTGMDVDDSGLVYLSIGGIIKVFRITDTDQLEFVPGAPLAGMEIGPTLRVTHSRTNYGAAVHAQPEWRDELPPEEPDQTEDCPADFNGDGLVNGQKVIAFLNAFVRGVLNRHAT